MTPAEVIWTGSVLSTIFQVLDAADPPFSAPKPVGNAVGMLYWHFGHVAGKQFCKQEEDFSGERALLIHNSLETQQSGQLHSSCCRGVLCVFDPESALKQACQQWTWKGVFILLLENVINNQIWPLNYVPIAKSCCQYGTGRCVLSVSGEAPVDFAHLEFGLFLFLAGLPCSGIQRQIPSVLPALPVSMDHWAVGVWDSGHIASVMRKGIPSFWALHEWV